MTLPDDIYRMIKKYSEEGERCFQKGDFQNAIRQYNQAINILPEPKTKWEAATWLYTAIGDTLYLTKNYSEALQAFLSALKSANGHDNPFINLRLGQCYYEVNNLKEAENYFLRAYLLEGKKIFDGEPHKYIDYMEQHYDL